MNCFLCYPLSKKYYLLHPWVFFKDTWLNLKAAWQRATKGYADRDTWNLDNYLLELLPEMIDNLRKNTHSFPGTNRFPTPESWDDYLLKEIIIPLRNARESQQVEKNEYEYEHIYPLTIENHILVDNAPPELQKKWMEREKQIYRWRENQRLRGFTALINEEIWHNLWD